MLSEKNHRAAYDRLLSKLRHARKDAHLSQAAVASLLDKPQSFVSKVETGERRLDFVELQFLARIYKKPLSYFQDDKLK